MIHTPPQKNKLLSIEFGRGVAALAVVAGHSQLVGMPEHIAGVSWVITKLAVEFFFILSGFIIFYIHRSDIGVPAHFPRYVWNRLVRIFPTYWLVFIIDVGLHLTARSHDAVPDTMSGLLCQIFLLPGDEPYISVAWSLRHELLFYGLFLVLILNRRIGIALFAAWLSAILCSFFLVGWHPENWPPSDTITNPVNLGFFIGIGLASLYRKRASATQMMMHGPWARFCLWIGAISYPLYLCHLTVYFVSGGIFKRLGLAITWQWHLLFVVLLSLAAATAVSLVYERPILKRLHKIGRLSSPHTKRLLFD